MLVHVTTTWRYIAEDGNFKKLLNIEQLVSPKRAELHGVISLKSIIIREAVCLSEALTKVHSYRSKLNDKFTSYSGEV
jgi:hypothetical protein